MKTCKCGSLKLGPVKGTVPVSLETSCPYCKTTVKVSS